MGTGYRARALESAFRVVATGRDLERLRATVPDLGELPGCLISNSSGFIGLASQYGEARGFLSEHHPSGLGPTGNRYPLRRAT